MTKMRSSELSPFAQEGVRSRGPAEPESGSFAADHAGVGPRGRSHRDDESARTTLREPSAAAPQPFLSPDQTASASQPWLNVMGSRHFLDWLAESRISLAFTTYQAGKLVVLRAERDVLNTHFAGFNRPMGCVSGIPNSPRTLHSGTMERQPRTTSHHRNATLDWRGGGVALHRHGWSISRCICSVASSVGSTAKSFIRPAARLVRIKSSSDKTRTL